MPEPRYFELQDTVGIEPTHAQTPDGPDDHPQAGQPGPFIRQDLQIAVPTMVGDDLIAIPTTYRLQGDGKTRRIRIEDPLVANAVASQTDIWREIDPPRDTQPHVARPSTPAPAPAADEES